MKSQRILVLTHNALVPPVQIPKGINWDRIDWETEYHVISTLEKMGHEVCVLGVLDEIKPIREMVETFKPHIVFNLLEEFSGSSLYDHHVVSLLELLHIPYTGCNPRGLMLCRDKALSKKILSYHRILSPKFCDSKLGRKPKISSKLNYPVIVKCKSEDASMGITQASICHHADAIVERTQFIFDRFECDAIVEEFIEGEEVFMGVMGNQRLTVFPPMKLHFDESNDAHKEIYSAKAKFDPTYRKRKGIHSEPAHFDEQLVKKLAKISKQAYRSLSLTGCARMDYRITKDGRIYLIEANPNPNIAWDDEFARSAKEVGLSYEKLLERLIRFGLKYAGLHAEFPHSAVA